MVSTVKILCEYLNEGHCFLQESIFQSNHYVTKGFCKNRCGESKKDKLKMLQNFGVYLAQIPSDLSKLSIDDVVLDDLGKRHWEITTDNRKAKEKKERQKKEITAAVAQLPSKYQLVKNMGKHAITVAKHYKQTGRVKVTEFHQEARLDICEACDKSKEVDDSLRCTLKSCGCHLTGDLGRLAFEALPCPIDKHKQIDLECKE
jgi:hypothetical protein